MESTDPIECSEKIKGMVCRGEKRKYYRFRSTRFYEGIATADCVGCNLDCRYCWSEQPRKKPNEIGEFKTPKEVAERLLNIAEKEGYSQVRISGNEPTIGKKHLFLILKQLKEYSLRFVLETNGILIGWDHDYAEALSNFSNLYVRVSLKGTSREQFSTLTGMDPTGFEFQLEALRNLTEAGCSCGAAIMKDFVNESQMNSIIKKLKEINPNLILNLELEKLKIYPHVKRRLGNHNLLERLED